MGAQNKGYRPSIRPDSNSKDYYSPGPQSELASVRFPVAYPPSQEITIRVAEGFDALVILQPVNQPPGAAAPHGWTGDWFKRVLYATKEAGDITFTPSDSDNVVVIDYMDGFEPTPVNLHYYASWFLAHRQGGGPAPGDTPVVT